MSPDTRVAHRRQVLPEPLFQVRLRFPQVRARSRITHLAAGTWRGYQARPLDISFGACPDKTLYIRPDPGQTELSHRSSVSFYTPLLYLLLIRHRSLSSHVFRAPAKAHHHDESHVP